VIDLKSSWFDYIAVPLYLSIWDKEYYRATLRQWKMISAPRMTVLGALIVFIDGNRQEAKEPAAEAQKARLLPSPV
jgi:hypothetical protein